MRARYVVLGTLNDLIVMSIKVPITFTNLISLDTSLILCGIRLDFKFKKAAIS